MRKTSFGTMQKKNPPTPSSNLNSGGSTSESPSEPSNSFQQAVGQDNPQSMMHRALLDKATQDIQTNPLFSPENPNAKANKEVYLNHLASKGFDVSALYPAKEGNAEAVKSIVHPNIIGQLINNATQGTEEGAKQTAEGAAKMYDPKSSLKDIATGGANAISGALKTGFSLGGAVLPELLTFNAAVKAVKDMPDSFKTKAIDFGTGSAEALTEKQKVENFDKVVDFPFAAASTIAEGIGYKPEDGSFGKATLEIANAILPIAIGKVGGIIKNIGDYKTVSEKIADKSASEEEIKGFVSVSKEAGNTTIGEVRDKLNLPVVQVSPELENLHKDQQDLRNATVTPELQPFKEKAIADNQAKIDDQLNVESERTLQQARDKSEVNHIDTQLELLNKNKESNPEGSAINKLIDEQIKPLEDRKSQIQENSDIADLSQTLKDIPKAEGEVLPQDIVDAGKLINKPFDPKKSPFQQISDAYYEAKKSGENPELIKKVDEIIKPKAETTPEVTVNPSGGVSAEGDAKVEEPTETFGVKNEKVNASAEKLGFKELLDEATKSASRDFGTVWDSAKAKIEGKEINVEELRKKLADNPVDTGLNHDETNAILLHDQITLENKLLDTINAINESGADEKRMAELQNEKAQLRSDLYDNFVASKKVGTEQGRGLNSRKMLADREFSLANMENEMRAEQNGEPLTASQEKLVEERYKAITEKAKEWDAFQKNKDNILENFRKKVEKEVEAKFGKEAKTISQKGRQIADSIRRLKSKASLLLDEKGLPILDKDGKEINLSSNNLYNDAIEIVATAIEKGADLADAINRGIKHLQDQDFYKNLSDENKKRVESQFEKQIKSAKDSKDAAKLEAQKKRYETLKQKYRDRRLREDFSVPERAKIIHDEESLRLQSELQKEKDLFYQAKEKARLSKLGWGERAANSFLELMRESLLTSPKTLGKLLSFDLYRSLVLRPMYNLASLPLRVFPKVNEIAKQAPTEGAFNGKALLKGEKAFVEKNTYVQMWNKLKKGGKSDLDLAYGNSHLSLPMFTTRTHGAVKQIGFNVEYNYAKAALDNAARKAGKLDDPSVQEFNNRYAYAKGMDAIYMKDSRFLKQYQLNLRLLENDKYGTKGKIAAFMARFLFPIVKVPYNFGKDVMVKHTPIGLTDAAIKSFKADVDKLTPEQADEIMLGLKKGLVGTTVMSVGGFALANRLGGFYSKDDKLDKTGLKEGETKIGKTVIPAWMNHNALTQAAQGGAEIAHLFAHAPKEYGTAEKMMSAVLMTGIEEASNLPFYSEIARDIKGGESDKAVAKIAADKLGQSIPLLVQWAAQQMDTKKGEIGFNPFTAARKVNTKSKGLMGTFGKEIQSKIPALRNKLPTK